MLQQKDGAAQDPASPHEDPPEPIEIEQAARAWGVQTDYWDIWGKQHHATTHLETAILQSLGVDLSSKAALRKAVESRTQRQWRSPLAPTIFLTAGKPHEIPVSLPVSQAGSRATLRIHLEDGRALEVEIALGELPAAETVELDGRPLRTNGDRLAEDHPVGY